MREGIDKEGYENHWCSITFEFTLGGSKKFIQKKRDDHKGGTQINYNNTYFGTHTNLIKHQATIK